MRYEDRVIDEVQTANDIVEVINQVVPLKRTGRNYKACCPFHQEKTPSFMVQPEKQIFHCFGCGTGGNVFAFLMRYENIAFPDALRQLAERAHIRLPEPSGKKGDGHSETEQLHEIYRLATDFYHAQFLHPEKGKAARDYLKQRGFDLELAEEFKLGWALPGWKNLFEFLSKKGFPEALLLKASLIQRSAQGSLYDTFRSRLLFPIHSLQGKVIGFGGRVIGESEGPKYLNSPENPIFHKRKELFGLHLAKRYIDRELPRILVVEGYLDFLRLYSEGFKAAVATLGTSLTEEHVQILKRFADEAVVIYDGDKAGEAASLRGLEVFLEGGMSVRLVRMPAGYDPDDFLKKKGAKDFEVLLAAAKDFFDYKLEISFSRYNRNDSLGLMKITNEFLETLVKVKNPILLNHYLKRLAGALGLDENSLRTELAKLQKKMEASGSRFQKDSSSRVAAVKINPNPDEILLLGLMIEDREIREAAFQELTESDFVDPVSRELFAVLLQMDANREEIAWARMLNRIDNEEWRRKLTANAHLEWSPESRKKALEDCLKCLKKKKLDKKMMDLRQQIARAEKDGNAAQLNAFTEEYQSLLRESKGSFPPPFFA